jgi:hypothetical protein
MHSDQCTYLNIGLLVAPREYLLASTHLVAMPEPLMLFIAVNDNGSSFTLASSAIWVASH